MTQQNKPEHAKQNPSDKDNKGSSMKPDKPGGAGKPQHAPEPIAKPARPAGK